MAANSSINDARVKMGLEPLDSAESVAEEWVECEGEALFGQNKVLKLHLTSGKALLVTRVQLFPEAKIRRLIALRAAAQEEMAGYSSGIGFIGSLGWVLSGAAVLGAVEGAISNAKVKKGFEILTQASLLQSEIKAQGKYFTVSELAGLDQPHPAHWSVTGIQKRKINLAALPEQQRESAIRRYRIQASQVVAGWGFLSEELSFIFFEDEFLWVESEAGCHAIRWSAVDDYQVVSV